MSQITTNLGALNNTYSEVWYAWVLCSEYLKAETEVSAEMSAHLETLGKVIF